jgi:hypothetical protein
MWHIGNNTYNYSLTYYYETGNNKHNLIYDINNREYTSLYNQESKKPS